MKISKIFGLGVICFLSIVFYGVINGIGCNYKIDAVDETNSRIYKGTCQAGILTYYALDKNERRLTKGFHMSFIDSIVIVKFYQDTEIITNNKLYLSMPSSHLLQKFNLIDVSHEKSKNRLMIFSSSLPERKVLKVRIYGYISFLEMLTH